MNNIPTGTRFLHPNNKEAGYFVSHRNGFPVKYGIPRPSVMFLFFQRLRPDTLQESPRLTPETRVIPDWFQKQLEEAREICISEDRKSEIGY